MIHPHMLLWRGIQGKDPEGLTGPQPGGVILFARNLDPDPVHGPRRLHGLTTQIQTRWGQGLPVRIAIDQEGGAVSRLRPWVGETPSLHHIWTQGGFEACRAWGTWWGQGLALLGIDTDFAPVADLWDSGPEAAMGDRAASSVPRETALAVGSFIQGLESTGTQGCLKHFPGLGGTTVDSHLDLPILKDFGQIQRNVEVFRILAHPSRLIMVAHLLLPQTHPLPASLSPLAVAQNPWGIRGCFLPDDLEMGALKTWTWEDRVHFCLEAGHDWLLVCQTPEGLEQVTQILERISLSHIQKTLERNLAQRRFIRLIPSWDQEAWSRWLSRRPALSDPKPSP